MRRFLSCLVLIVFYFLISIIFNVETNYIVSRFNNFQELELWRKIIYVLLSGGAIIFTVFYPVIFITGISIGVCDWICHSEKGTRYKTLGIFILTFSALSIIFSLFDISTSYANIIYSILMGSYGINLVMLATERKEEYEMKKTLEEEQRISSLVEAKLREEKEREKQNRINW